MRRTQEQRREATQTALLDAAYEAFRTKGFAASSLDAIARDAGYTIGAVYAHFPTKLALAWAVVSRRMDDVQARASVPHAGADPVDAIAAVLLEPESTDPGAAVFMLELLAHSVRDPEQSLRFAAGYGEARTRALSVLTEHGLEVPRGARDRELLALQVVGLVNGLRIQRLVDPTVPAHAALADALRALLGSR